MTENQFRASGIIIVRVRREGPSAHIESLVQCGYTHSGDFCHFHKTWSNSNIMRIHGTHHILRPRSMEHYRCLECVVNAMCVPDAPNPGRAVAMVVEPPTERARRFQSSDLPSDRDLGDVDLMR